MAHVALRVTALLSLGLLWGPAYAQEPEPLAADPPGRAARLSHLEGDVSLQPVGEEAWAPAFINRPLTTGDKVWTESGARAEIQVASAAVRLDGNTGFSFLNVDDDTVQMRLTAGVMHVTVSRLEGSEQIEIATPNVALWLLRTGTYRVEVNDAGDSTVVKVREGAVDARSPSQDVVVHAGQAVTFSGTDDIVARIETLGSPDEFDSWSDERARRDTRLATSRTAEYVSPDVTGYEDLEDHGTWSSEPDYGYVWTPRHVAVDWAPYRYGRWVWVSPWGWTWIDDARWGYAPFHYGRWVHLRHRWCWVPGPRHHRAVFAPALVAWIGTPGLHVTWYPLGPRDVYVPWRRHSWRYVERVNTSNMLRVVRSHIQDAYDRRAPRPWRGGVPHGVTSTSNDAFAMSRRVRDHLVRVDERELSGNSRRAAAPRIDPRRESRLGSAQISARVPPRRIAERPVVVRREPPAVAANLVRNPANSRDALRVAGRVPRPQVERNGPESNGMGSVVRDRVDRPSRLQGQRPQVDDSRRWQTRSPDRATGGVQMEQPTLGQRLRESRERELRENRPQNDAWRRARSSEPPRPEAAGQVQQRWQTQSGEVRQHREQPRAREPSQVVRERFQQQRQLEQRPVERRQAEPRPNVQRPTMSAPRPQVQRPVRSEAPRQSAPPRPASQSRPESSPRQTSPRRNDNFSRARER